MWWYLSELPQGRNAARVGELFQVRGVSLCLREVLGLLDLLAPAVRHDTAKRGLLGNTGVYKSRVAEQPPLCAKGSGAVGFIEQPHPSTAEHHRGV